MSRNERTYYLVSALYNLSWSFIGPMYALFLLDRGLDLFQMSVVPAVYWIVSFVFEVPTGAFADLAGRKRAFVLSCAVRMGAFGLYAFAHSFLVFVVAEFIDALGSTLANGALDAWVVDGLRGEGAARPADHLFARAQVVARVLITLGGLAGGYLAAVSFTWPWIAAAVSFLSTGMVAMVAMRNDTPHAPSHTRESRSLMRTMGSAFAIVRDAPVLVVLCGVTFLAAFAMMPTYMLWQPRLQALSGQGVWLMGWVWVLINLAMLVGSASVPRLVGRFGREAVLVVAMLWRATALGAAAVASGFMPALLGILCMEVGFGLSDPLMQAWTNEHATARYRATVLSIRSMFLTLGGGTGLICIGFIARRAGIPIAWGVGAVFLTLTVPAVLLTRRWRVNAVTGIMLPRAGADMAPGL